MLLTLFVALVLGSLLGLERSLAGKVAGMRTYGLVSLGSAVFVLISETVLANYLTAGVMTSDPLRMAAQVITGIGFLGAGLIIFQDHKVHGLTTAAGLWVAAGVGMAVGYQFYSLALAVTILTLVIFTMLWPLENYLAKKLAKRND